MIKQEKSENAINKSRLMIELLKYQELIEIFTKERKKNDEHQK